MRLLFAGLCLVTPAFAIAQFSSDTLARSVPDTARQLDEVVVTGYAQNRRLLETGASVGLLTARDLQQRFGTPSLVPAMNTLPGVRMEERSPGSYRVSIRGSSLRSPFGVRNVKTYWNDIPLTDAGGNTPLNALDVRALGRVEVIKGPAGSLYGAGTGGTLLFTGLAVPVGKTAVEASVLGGSYGLFGNGLTVQTGTGKTALSASYNHLRSDGYRDHSALVRDNVSLVGSFGVSDKRTVSVLGFYSDLHYQTPGGLTEAQFRANPRASRPATRTLPGSAEQNAGIYQKLGFLGVSQQYRLNDRWQNTTVLYGSTTDLSNPFITNYERRTDQGVGGRTVTQYRFPLGRVTNTLTFGAEYGRNFTVTRNFGNRRGTPDTLQTDDELLARQWLAFVQHEADLTAGFRLTAGVSLNSVRYGFTRFSTAPVLPQARTFAPVWLPRLALAKNLRDNLLVFVSVSTGYSAPSSQEVRPSEGTFNRTLDPEQGVSYELGTRGQVLNGRLQFDVALYRFALRQTIVRRTVDNGAEFFVNAGRTDQRGLEANVAYQLLPERAAGVFRALRLWHSLTLTRYRFRDYQQGSLDVSGNRVTGVPPTTAIVGLDADLRRGFYAHLTYQFLDPFPLNDANTVLADPTRILQATLGYRRSVGRFWTVDAFVSGDNLLNQVYSLGYDLNAFGGRFYNAAPGRNATVGLRLRAAR